MCRLGARQLSTLKPQLDASNVKFIGVGLEELGVEDFVQGKFFDGELYIDTKKECYSSLGYKRIGFFGALGAVFGKKGRNVLSEAKSQGISNNLKGDGFQNGGTLVVSAGGKEVLLNFKQEGPGDHVELSEVLKALSIQGDAPAAATDKGKVECNDDVCQIKK